METNKFEEHIEEKLKAREIQPSEMAWERISGRLETPQTSKTKNYFWYGIAASFMGVLLISILFMNRAESPDDNEIVTTPETNKEIELKEELLETRDTEALKVVLEEGVDSTPNNAGLARTVLLKQDVAGAKGEKTKSKPNDLTDKGILNGKLDKTTVSDALVEAKVAELLEKVVILEQNDSALADAEVDSLLKIAQEEILANQRYDNNGTLDASALLAEVEDELDQSFRNQIFEKLKTGLLKVRTAVADRNN